MWNIWTKTAIIMWAVGIIVNNTPASIIVSGDANIALSIERSFAKYNEYNQVFFENLLSGGDRVAVLDQLAPASFLYGIRHSINSFYGALPGVASNLIQTVSEESLLDVDLLVMALPATSFSTDEIGTMKSFYENGGSIFFLGDSWKQAEKPNGNINLALQGIGSEIQIDDKRGIDGGLFSASGECIITNGFTSGVSSLTYGYVSEVKGGTPLFLAKDHTTPFVAFEKPVSVAEPATTSLLLTGLLFLLGFAKRNRD
jgi:hypothetical protein